MARIRTYELDSTITANDYLLGNDADGGSIITKRFSVEDLRQFYIDGLGSSIPDTIPSGFVSSVSHDNSFRVGDTGNVNENSYIRVIEHDRILGVPLTFTSAGTIMNLSLNGDGTTTVDFVNYYEPYVLNTFSGFTFTIVDSVAGTITGTFGGVVDVLGSDNKIHPFGYDSNNRYYYSVAVELTAPITQTYQNLDSLTIDSTPSRLSYEVFDLETDNLIVGGDLTVLGNSSLQDLDVNRNLNVDGTSNFGMAASFDEGFALGEAPNEVTYTPSSTGVAVDGAAMNFGNSVTFQQTIQAEGGVNTPDGMLEVVAGNTGTTNRGLLNKLQIGDQVFDIPAASNSGIIEALPGVSEVLAGAANEITAVRFYNGIEEGNASEFQAAYPAINLASNTAQDGLTLTIATGTRDTLNTQINNRPAGQRTFFLDQTNTFDLTTAQPGDIVTGNVYELIAYDNSTGIVRFGLLTGGEFHISTDRVFVEGITNSGVTEDTLVSINNQTGEIASTGIGIQGVPTFRDINYNLAGGGTSPISQIVFSPSDAVTANAGVVTVDLTSTRNVFGAYYSGTIATNPIAVAQRIYVLGPIDQASSLILPANPDPGDQIGITNISTAMGQTSQTWSLTPSAGSRILRTTEPLVLDVLQSFTLAYTDADNGWVII